MEVMNIEDTSESHALLSMKHCDSPLLISCNWQINNNKQFIDAVTIAPMQHAPVRINCEDVASLDTCIALQPVNSSVDSNTEPCMLDIKVTNCQRIARIAIVSEGNVLEIFKQFGEYETTILAEFVDEYEDNIVFLGETMIRPPTTEISIKFIRTKNKSPPMWVYGIRLFLTDSTKEAKSSAFDYDIIQTFLSNASNDKTSQGFKMAKKVFEFYDRQEIMNKEKIFQTLASGSKDERCINEMKRSNNEEEFPNCRDKQSNASECKNNEMEYPTREGNYKTSDTEKDITSYDNKTRSRKEAKSSAFNYKDFMQTFLSNSSNDKMSQQFEVMELFGFYNKQELNNEQFHQKILETVALNSNSFKHKNEIDNGKECLSHRDDYKKSDSLKNKNLRSNSDKDCTDCEDQKKSDIDIKIYIDNKFHDIEKRLMERIDKMEANTNQKLNTILEKLESQLSL
ncbi:uncharacterized protein LOC105432369 [Pogonomyrmex barbatus]|uniref:Uncharacterized protein LOC105432369 n=1 Tax=Pogonomyrmex barbatus TaxID=144034 RepID=A0A6I9WQH0_9HYME|nr:uncharacterized protein LOC105432369 [Pogonomyrmex barbatus]XP_011645457.1 uncharacterized protein LOC105432369 [Pogonomyrmex barbatus]